MNGGVVLISLIGLIVFAVSFVGNFVDFTQTKNYSSLMWAVLMLVLMICAMMMIAVNSLTPALR